MEMAFAYTTPDGAIMNLGHVEKRVRQIYFLWAQQFSPFPGPESRTVFGLSFSKSRVSKKTTVYKSCIYLRFGASSRRDIGCTEDKQNFCRQIWNPPILEIWKPAGVVTV